MVTPNPFPFCARGKRWRPTRRKIELTRLLDGRLIPCFYPPPVPSHDPECHRRSKGCDTGFLLFHATVRNSAFLQTLMTEMSGRQAARAEYNVLSPFFPLPGAHRRVFVDCVDLPLDSSFSTADKNKSVKVSSKEPENSLLDHDPSQVDICHGWRSWFDSRRERKRWWGEERKLSCREANAFPDGSGYYLSLVSGSDLGTD